VLREFRSAGGRFELNPATRQMWMSENAALEQKFGFFLDRKLVNLLLSAVMDSRRALHHRSATDGPPLFSPAHSRLGIR